MKGLYCFLKMLYPQKVFQPLKGSTRIVEYRAAIGAQVP